MEVGLLPELAARFSSASQRARVLTEDWAKRELYCPACPSPRLEPHPTGLAVHDFFCPKCDQQFQVKGKASAFGRSVTNSAYEKKIEAIRANRAPNYVFVRYDLPSSRIESGFVLPGHFLTENVIMARRPLGPNARRHGWVGSTILLGQIPVDGRISLVAGFLAHPPAVVRAAWERFRFLRRAPSERRGWIEDILRLIRDLKEPEFHLRDLYAHEPELARLHPANRNILPKIRQQVELLRDRSILRSLGKGRYVIAAPPPP